MMAAALAVAAAEEHRKGPRKEEGKSEPPSWLQQLATAITARIWAFLQGFIEVIVVGPIQECMHAQGTAACVPC